jgi:hypothetical protein
MGRKKKPVTYCTERNFLEKLQIFTLKEIVALGIKPLTYLHDMSFETWLSKTNYPEWRKQELRKYEVEITNLLQRNEHGKLIKFVIKLFMKDEFYVKYTDVRGIYARDEAAKITFGPWFKAIEEQIYSLPDFIKHVPVRDRPKYIYERLNRPGGIYIATDYSKFESHFTKSLMLAVEFVLYEYILLGFWVGKKC